MKDVVLILGHVAVTAASLLGPGGMRAVVAENLLLKHEAFPWDTAPRYLLRDRDGVYGPVFQRRVTSIGIDDVNTTPRSPWRIPMWSTSSGRYGVAA